jgi:excisionase family DNA binding protein
MSAIYSAPHVRVRDAAHYVGLSKSTLDKMRMHEGGPAFHKLGRAIVYATTDLDAWLAGKRRSSTWSNDNSPEGEHLAA